MGADYWTAASVRLLARSARVVVPHALSGLGHLNDAGDVWFWDSGLADDTALYKQLLSVSDFLVDHQSALQSATDSTVSVFVGWAPNRTDDVMLKLDLIDAVSNLGGTVVFDVYGPETSDAAGPLSSTYWSRLRLEGGQAEVLIDDDVRRTADLADEWLRLLLEHRAATRNFDGARLVLDWLPADQDGLVLTPRLLEELARQRIEFAVRVIADS